MGGYITFITYTTFKAICTNAYAILTFLNIFLGFDFNAPYVCIHREADIRKFDGLTDFIFPIGRISSRTDAKNFKAIPPLVTSGFP